MTDSNTDRDSYALLKVIQMYRECREAQKTIEKLSAALEVNQPCNQENVSKLIDKLLHQLEQGKVRVSELKNSLN